MDFSRLELLNAASLTLANAVSESRTMLAETEQALLAMKLEVQAHVSMNRVYDLCYRKLNDDWGLYITGGAGCAVKAKDAEAATAMLASIYIDDLLTNLISVTETQLRSVNAVLTLKAQKAQKEASDANT